MPEIEVDKNGWINPTCPYCECVMEINFHKWIGGSVERLPHFNIYCRYCHYACEVYPATTDMDCNRQQNKIRVYNESKFAKCNCNGMPHHPYSCDNNGEEEE